MTFEEYFPLINKAMLEGRPPGLDVISDCCLDKERVREAIKKCSWNERGCEYPEMWLLSPKTLLRELGL